MRGAATELRPAPQPSDSGDHQRNALISCRGRREKKGGGGRAGGGGGGPHVLRFRYGRPQGPSVSNGLIRSNWRAANAGLNLAGFSLPKPAGAWPPGICQPRVHAPAERRQEDGRPVNQACP